MKTKTISRQRLATILKTAFVFLCLSLVVQTANAQSQVISGKVVDSNGEPIIGASVTTNGGKNGTVTDFDGNFKLQAHAGTKVTVSYIGYTSQSFTAKAGANKIVLQEDNNVLKEVQIVGYGQQKKITVTGAVSNLDGKALVETPTGSIQNMLAGAVTGLSSVQVSGEPGSDAASIYVRGKATFNSDGQSPLIQVDGVERSFNDLDPNEIESITVLKDASATAVYGVRGANGVVLITTKRGKEGAPKINFSTSLSLVAPTKPIDLANSYQYATFYNKMLANDGKDPLFSDAVIEKFRTNSDPILYPSTNWTDYALDNLTLQSQHNMSISGGTQNARYFISVGYYAQDGMFEQFDLPYDCTYQYRRFNYRANLDLDVTKTTTLSLNLSGKNARNVTPYSGQGATGWFKQMYFSTPFSSPGIVNHRLIYTTTDYAENPLPFTGGNGLGYYGTGFIQNSTNTLNVDLNLVQKLDMITKGLSFKMKGAYNSDFYVYKDGVQALATYTPVQHTDGTIGYRKNGENAQMSYTYSTGKARDWYMEAGVNYDRDFGLHHVSALVLYNQSKSYYPSQYSDIPSGYVGLVGRVAYDWNNRYMAEFNMGYNGSENFAPSKRFGFFPAGSLGWVISDEPFFKPLKKVISFMKLRATYGIVGNDKIGGSRFMYTPDTYGVNNDALFNRNGKQLGYGYNFGIENGTATLAAYEAAKHNADVTWEKSYKQNYGVDINFFEDRMRINADYYFERRRDILLFDYTAPNLIGFTLPAANLGSVNSWGWELSANWKDKIKDFSYWIGVNLSYNQNEIKEMKEEPKSYSYQEMKGHRIGSRSLYKFWKYYYTGCEEDYKKEFGQDFPTQIISNDQLKPGDCVYVDLNGDGKIDSNDASRELSHTDDPEYVLGVNLGFSWKNWDVSTRWTGAFAVSRQLSGIFMQPFHSAATDNQGGLLMVQYDNTWTEDNPDPNALYPRATWANKAQNYVGSTLFERDASYLRLKSLDITYHFKFAFMKKLKMNDLALSFSSYNLLTFTGFDFGDPESRVTDAPAYPLTKTYSFSLKVGF